MIIIIDEASAKLASFYYHGEIFKPQWKRAADMSSAPADCIWIVSNRQQKQIADSLGIASVGEPQCGTRYEWKALQSLILSIWSGCAGGIIISHGTSARQTGV